MGHGTYSTSSRSTRAESLGYTDMSKGVNETFKERKLHSEMNPKNVRFRECVDTNEHPTTVPVIIALDVTGSMGMIPRDFIAHGLPTIVSRLIQAGIEHVSIMIMAIGDHEVDSAPLQVGQFEASDELIDKWLSSIYVEQGGGGNSGESYFLAHYFAGYHTKIDAFEKRNTKGFLFTIGDEPTLDRIFVSHLKAIMGDNESIQGNRHNEITAVQCIDQAQTMYNVYHLHVAETRSGERPHVFESWKKLLGQQAISVSNYKDIPMLIGEIILSHTGISVPTKEKSTNPTEETPETPDEFLL